MVFYPQHLRQCINRPQPHQRPFPQQITRALFGPIALCLRAVVEPDRHPLQGLPGAIDKHRAIDLPRQTDTGDLRWVNISDRLTRRRAQPSPPILRVLLDPPRMRLVERILGLPSADEVARLVDEDGLGASRAQINAQCAAHMTLLSEPIHVAQTQIKTRLLPLYHPRDHRPGHRP